MGSNPNPHGPDLTKSETMVSLIWMWVSLVPEFWNPDLCLGFEDFINSTMVPNIYSIYTIPTILLQITWCTIFNPHHQKIRKKKKKKDSWIGSIRLAEIALGWERPRLDIIQVDFEFEFALMLLWLGWADPTWPALILSRAFPFTLNRPLSQPGCLMCQQTK